jgi:biopolymer transport protein ExbD
MAMIELTPVPAHAGPNGTAPGRAGPPQRRRPSLFRLIGAEPTTISEINTTPLIDVMLVLLIMFIITIPAATHKVPLDLPRPTLTPLPPRPFHQLDIAASGALSWNGAALSDGQLQERLLQVAADPGTPELRLNAAGEARFDRVDHILAQIRLAGVERLGFIGNERYGRAF